MITNLPAARAPDDRFLEKRHFLKRHLDAQVASRHHHAVGFGQNFIEMGPRLGLFDLGDHGQRFGALGGQELAQSGEILATAHERQGHHVDAGRQAPAEPAVTIAVR